MNEVIDFVYGESFYELVEKGLLEIVNVDLKYIEGVRGITFENGDIWINLSAVQWRDYNEDKLIDKIGKTIIHENIHSIMINTETTPEYEEFICKVMAEQLGLPIKTETFK